MRSMQNSGISHGYLKIYSAIIFSLFRTGLFLILLVCVIKTYRTGGLYKNLFFLIFKEIILFIKIAVKVFLYAIQNIFLIGTICLKLTVKKWMPLRVYTLYNAACT